MGGEVDFVPVDKDQSFLFDISLQYLQKKVGDEVEFWHANKHDSFLQLDLSWEWSSIFKVPKIASLLQCLYNISERIFCVQ